MLTKPLSFGDVSLPLDNEAMCVELCKDIAYKCRPDWPDGEELCSKVRKLCKCGEAMQLSLAVLYGRHHQSHL